MTKLKAMPSTEQCECNPTIKIVKVEVKTDLDKEQMIFSLINSGYKIWLTTVNDVIGKRNFVNFEIKDIFIRDKE